MAARPDVEIHTGQQFEETDKRNARFNVTGFEKQVNSKWAIDLIAAQPVIKVKTRIVRQYRRCYLLLFDVLQVACDGRAGGSLGHPKVYINLDGKGPVSCTYCGLRYEMVKDDENH